MALFDDPSSTSNVEWKCVNIPITILLERSPPISSGTSCGTVFHPYFRILIVVFKILRSRWIPATFAPQETKLAESPMVENFRNLERKPVLLKEF